MDGAAIREEMQGREAPLQSGAKLSVRMIEVCVETAMDFFSEAGSLAMSGVRSEDQGMHRKGKVRSSSSEDESQQAWAYELRHRMREAVSKRPQLLEELRKASRLRVTGDENVRIRDHVSKKVTGRVKKVSRRVDKYVKRPPVVKTIDKLIFTSGVIWVAATEYILLCKASRLGLWYLASIGPLMAHRVYTYRKAGFIYFTYDFCYWTNALCCVWIILKETGYTPSIHHAFFRVIFCFCNGPLIFAVVIWRNSFIFHSLDHVCSTMLHALPPLWTYTVRWSPSAIGHSTSRYHILQTFMLATSNYMLWQAIYLVKTEWLDRHYLKNSPDQYTSLRWMVKDSRGAMYKLCKKVLMAWNLMQEDEEFDQNAWRTKITFWTAQFLYTLITFFPVPFMWYSQTCHAACLVLIFIVAIYNGASYYIEIFSRRYNLKFEHDPQQHPSSASKEQNHKIESASENKQKALEESKIQSSFDADGHERTHSYEEEEEYDDDHPQSFDDNLESEDSDSFNYSSREDSNDDHHRHLDHIDDESELSHKSSSVTLPSSNLTHRSQTQTSGTKQD